MKECPTRVRTGRVLAQLADRDEPHDRRRRHRLAALVDEEAAVRVAVEGQAHVGAGLADLLLRVDEVLRLDGVGLVVGEGAVQLEVERHQVHRQAGEHGGDGPPRHAVAGVHHHREPAHAGQVDEPAEVGGVVGQQVALGDPPGPAPRRRRRQAVLQPATDLAEAGVLADRGGAGAAQLDAVVGGGVVAGGEHRAGEVEAAGGEVEVVGGAHADVDDVGAAPGGALGERGRQPGRGGAHVAGDHDRVAAGQLDERGADLAGEPGVQLVGHQPADVVGLDELGEVGHRASLRAAG